MRCCPHTRGCVHYKWGWLYEQSSERPRRAWKSAVPAFGALALVALMTSLAPTGAVAGAVERVVGAIRMTMLMIGKMVQKTKSIFRGHTEQTTINRVPEDVGALSVRTSAKDMNRPRTNHSGGSSIHTSILVHCHSQWRAPKHRSRHSQTNGVSNHVSKPYMEPLKQGVCRCDSWSHKPSW